MAGGDSPRRPGRRSRISRIREAVTSSVYAIVLPAHAPQVLPLIAALDTTGVAVAIAAASALVSFVCVCVIWRLVHATKKKVQQGELEDKAATGTESTLTHTYEHQTTEACEAPTSNKPEQSSSDTQDALDDGASSPTAEADEVPPSEPESESKGEAQSAGEAQPDQDPSATESFDFRGFCRALLLSPDFLKTLNEIVEDIRERKNKGNELPGAELFLLSLLGEESLLWNNDEKRPEHVELVRPSRSGVLYVRTMSSAMEYGTYLRILRIEAALNALRFCSDYYNDDLDGVGMEDLFRVWQRTTSSVCAQVSNVDTANWSYLAMPWQGPFGPSTGGEWAVRHALSEAIETVQVPYRLEATFRCNVSGGDVAIEFGVTPQRVFPRSAFVPGLGIVATTRQMREREASKYAARMGILLANHAFRASSRIQRVWVSAIRETPSKHECMYSVCMRRRDFSRLRMAAISDPFASLRSLGAIMAEEDGALSPVTPCFYLEDELFCPSRRHDIWKLSERVLPAPATMSLGASRVSGLAIHEELPRTLAADEVLRNMEKVSSANSTERSVRTVMNVAQSTSDISVWSAAERVATKLIDGRLDPQDADALHDELVEGDALSRSVSQAQRLLFAQQPHDALKILQNAVRAIDDQGLYRDTDTLAYRCFGSFAERVLYNRLYANGKQAVALAPDAYLSAQLALSTIYGSLPPEEGGSMERALAHANTALRVAPLSIPAHLSVATCLEAQQDLEAATERLNELLTIGYQPQGLAVAYHHLAHIHWQLGNSEASQACFMRGVSLFPPLLPYVATELQLFLEMDENASLQSMDQVAMEKALRSAGIPVAPTSRTTYILYDGATASVDAEVFPVAQDLMLALEVLYGDDVFHGIRMSLEREPDL